MKRTIQKKISFYWSDSKLSWLRYLSIFSFRKYNPDWDINIYYCNSDEQLEKTWLGKVELDFTNGYNKDDYFNKLQNLNINIIQWKPKFDITNGKYKSLPSSYKCDIFEWEILYTEGGFFSDFDILYYRSIDDLYEEIITHDFDTLICSKPYMSIGFMASYPSNLFFRDVYNMSLKTFDKINYQSSGVVAIYETLKPKITHCKDFYEVMLKTDFIKCFNDIYQMNKLYDLETSTVYPICDDQNKIFLHNIDVYEQFPKSIGIHWYGGNPLAQNLNRIINENNYKYFNNTLATCIKKVLED